MASITPNTSNTSNAEQALNERLQALKAQLAARAPTEVSATFEGHIAQLLASDVAASAKKAGERAPDFTLPDALGHPVTLSELLARGPVVVTFYRGAWCPYCNMQLRAYQQILPQIAERGATLVAISAQTPDNSLSMIEKAELTFPVLSDKSNLVARHYGLVFAYAEHLRDFYKKIGVDLPAFNGDESWELPVPGTFVVAQDGIIRLAYANANWTHRLEPGALLDALRALESEHTAA